MEERDFVVHHIDHSAEPHLFPSNYKVSLRYTDRRGTTYIRQIWTTRTKAAAFKYGNRWVQKEKHERSFWIDFLDH